MKPPEMTPAEMAALHRACFSTPPPWSADAFATLLADPLVTAISEPNALLVVRLVAGEAEILTLAVHPDRRRQGVARRLVAAFHHQIAGRAESTFLEVAADNVAAQALYGVLGYQLAGRRRGYYRSATAAPVDALVLRCDLSHPAAPDI